MFHLRNLQGSSNSLLKTTFVLALLTAGLLFGLMALGRRLFRPDALQRNDLDGRQCASRIRRLLHKPCTVLLLNELNLAPTQRQYSQCGQALRPLLQTSYRLPNLFGMNVLKDLHQNESRL